MIKLTVGIAVLILGAWCVWGGQSNIKQDKEDDSDLGMWI